PISSTAPGSLFAAIASLINLETVAKSAALVASGGVDGAARPGVGVAAAAAGANVVFALSLNAVGAVSPREQAATAARRTVPTAAPFRKASRKALLAFASDDITAFTATVRAAQSTIAAAVPGASCTLAPCMPPTRILGADLNAEACDCRTIRARLSTNP